MHWTVIRRVRPFIESEGYFVIEVNEDHFKCTHLDDAAETLYYIYPTEEDGYAVYTSKLEQL